jgi:hypothetical protein
MSTLIGSNKAAGHVTSHPAPPALTLAGPSNHARYRHVQTHRHVNGTRPSSGIGGPDARDQREPLTWGFVVERVTVPEFRT